MSEITQTKSITLREGAKRLAKRLAKAGYQAFWVGGCVRDAQLGQSPKDYDIATDAKPDDIERLFRKTIPVGKHFGVMMVLEDCLLYTSPSPRDKRQSRMPSSA